jgi:hypothetical protein
MVRDILCVYVCVCVWGGGGEHHCRQDLSEFRLKTPDIDFTSFGSGVKLQELTLDIIFHEQQ